MKSTSSPLMPVESLRRIDAACDQFEAAWKSGREPRIEDYLALFRTEERPHLLQALQELERELITRRIARTERRNAATDDKLVPVTPQRNPVANSSPAAANAGGALDSDEATAIWNGASVRISVVAGPHAGVEFECGQHNTLVVGRSAQAQLRLKDDPNVSRHHLRFEINPPQCYVMDLGSVNGTLVNGQRVKGAFVQDGDVISAGRNTRLAISIVSLLPPGAVPSARVSGRRDDGAQSREVTQPATAPTAPHRAVPAPERAPAFSIGPQIAGYTLKAKVAETDFGTIYDGIEQGTGRPCVIKVISLGEQSGERAAKVFLREVEVLKQLQHPNIVRLVDAGRSPGLLYFVTEHVAPLDWSELAAKYAPETRIRIATGLVRQVLGALQYAHARSFVHRDVKPANLLLMRADGKLRAKLADFGVAKRYTDAGLSHMTRDGDIVGSLPFMAPDQFINSRDATPACDIYSAGATLYWMLTGQEPILLDRHPCKFLAILEDSPVPLKERLPSASPELCAVVHRALEKDPLRRFRSADEFQFQLKAACGP